MTHIAWVPEQWVEAATGTLAGLAERHPSRTILLFPRPDDPATCSRARSTCAASSAGASSARSAPRWSPAPLRPPRLRAGERGHAAARLRPAGLPALARAAAVRRARARPARRRRRPARRRLPRVARRERRPGAAAELFDRIAVSDIAWARTEPWRCGVADLWPDVAEASACGSRGPSRKRCSCGAGSRRGSAARSGSSTSRPASSSSSRWTAARRARPGRAADVERPALRPARGLRPRPDLRGGGTELLVGPDLAELAAGWIAERARGRSPFRIALTGGSAPRPVYERLAELDLDWRSWEVWWSDERVVPSDHPDSNERLAREALLSRVPILEERIHPLRVAGRGAAAGVRPRPPRPRLGRPHGLALPRARRRARRPGPARGRPRAGPAPPHPRLSFSLAYLNAQPLVAFLVGGRGKARDPRAHPGG